MNELFQLQTSYPLPKLKRLPLREQPAYRVTQNPDGCSLAELLAVLVGGPTQIEIAEDLLYRYGSVRRLHQAHLIELARVKGLGQGKALRLKAALALGKRILQEPDEERPTIQSPADAAALLMGAMSLHEQEHLNVLLLDTRNRLLEIVEVYHGALNTAQVRVAEVFKPAIQRMAAAIIVAHNHPSGDPNPSPDDIAVTRAMAQVGRLLDVSLLDHIVIGRGGRYVSLKERNLGFGEQVNEAPPDYRVGEEQVIYRYTRTQALEDGVLVDVSQTAQEAGFRLPAVITAGLHAELQPNRRERALGQSYAGRLWDVLFMAHLAARRAIWESQTAFQVSQAVCAESGGRMRRRKLRLWIVVGPGDAGEAVITIGFPQDF